MKMKIFTKIKAHKKLAIFIFLILLVFLSVFKPKQSKPVSTQQVKSGDVVISVSTNGTVFAKNSVNLSFSTSGILSHLGVKKGDFVNANQTIAMLDQKAAQNNLKKALKDYLLQRNTFDQTQDNNQGRTPDQALNIAMKRILQNNQYDLDKSVLSVEFEALVKEQSLLTTPISGIVTRTDVSSSGVFVSPSTVFTVSDPFSMVFAMDIDEVDIGKISGGQIAKIVLDAYPDEVFDLQVSYIEFQSHMTSTGATAYTVEVNLPKNQDLKFRIGLNGEGEIILKEAKNALYVSLSSVFNKKYVYIKTKAGFEKREVALGLQNDTQVEIIIGLNIKDTIVTDPLLIPNRETQRLPIPFLRRIFR